MRWRTDGARDRDRGPNARSAAAAIGTMYDCDAVAEHVEKRSSKVFESPPCVLADGRNAKARGFAPGRSSFDADDERTAFPDPDAARLGDLRSAGGRRHQRMRGARLDAGSRRSARPAYDPSTSRVRIRRRACLLTRPPPKSATCWIRSATPARSAPAKTEAELRNPLLRLPLNGCWPCTEMRVCAQRQADAASASRSCVRSCRIAH